MTSAATIRRSSSDIWALAAGKLSDEDKSIINFNRPDKLNILSDLQVLTAQAKQKCLDKRWRYTRKSGETVIIRDLLDKVVKWIDLFRQVGDVAVQYDPVHAVIPWAGVRFLLLIAVNDSSRFTFAIESATSIAEMICRYAIVEDLFLPSVSQAAEELNRALVNLYAAILLYLSKAKSYFQQCSAKRIVKSGLLAESDLEACYSSIDATQHGVHRCLALVGMQDQINKHTELKRILEQIDAPLNRLSEDLKSIQDNLEASKRREILCWMSPEPYKQHHEQTKKDVLSGTGKWLLSDPVFNKWKKESVSSILWLHGIPGSGKSKLVSIVIEDAMQAFRTGQHSPPAFFYCSRNSAERARSNPEAILASIARQLSRLEPGLPLLDPAITLYKQREVEGFASGSLQIDESSALIIQLVEHYPQTIIVIDALDECDPEKRAYLLESLETVLRESSRLVKIFVSSRDDQDIVCHLQDYPNLEIASDKNLEDIVSFVKVETQDLIKRRKLLRFSSDKEELERIVIDRTTKGANGMFLWASLQLQSLCDLKTDEAIRERIGRLPPKLEDLYMELYQKFTNYPAEADRRITRNALSWLLCAPKTLKSTEYLTAISITPRGSFSQISKDQVLDTCCNLVVFDPSLDTFRFAHLSVREFLEKQPEYNITAINCLAAETCLFNLLCATSSSVKEKFFTEHGLQLARKSFLSEALGTYPTIYWAVHCQLSGHQRAQGVLMKLFLFFMSNDSDPISPISLWFDSLRELLNKSSSIERKLRGKLQDSLAGSLFVACSFDFSEVLGNRDAGGNFQGDLINSTSQTAALCVAVRYGSCEVASVLLTDQLTEVTEEVVKAAAGNTDSGKEVMTLLLDRQGADISITEKMVKAAAGNPGDGKEVMTLLFDRRGADISITEEVIKAAARNLGDGKRVMTLLFDRREADISITEEVIEAAARNPGNGKEVMTLLFDRRGADISITEKIVKAAAGNTGNGKEVMTLLFDRRGADISITEEVVKAAAGNPYNSKEVMTLLLDRRGADISITEEVVKAAARNLYNSKEVMTLLLDRRGADISITEEVIKAAAGNPYNSKEVMTLLLDRRGADISITEEVVKAAAGNDKNGIHLTGMLLDYSMGFAMSNAVLEAAATSGQECTLNFLEQRCQCKLLGSDLRETARLFAASKAGNQAEVDRVLTTGINPDLKNPNGVTPLWIAALYGHTRIIQRLLDTNAVDINTSSISGRTPLFWPAAQNQRDVVKLLLEKGASYDYVDVDGHSPLSMTEKNNAWDAFRLLKGEHHHTIR